MKDFYNIFDKNMKFLAQLTLRYLDYCPGSYICPASSPTS